MSATPLIFLAGVLMGSGSAISTKVLYGLSAVGESGAPQYFEKPLVLTFVMFASMCLALPLHWAKRWYDGLFTRSAKMSLQISGASTPTLGAGGSSAAALHDTNKTNSDSAVVLASGGCVSRPTHCGSDDGSFARPLDATSATFPTRPRTSLRPPRFLHPARCGSATSDPLLNLTRVLIQGVFVGPQPDAAVHSTDKRLSDCCRASLRDRWSSGWPHAGPAQGDECRGLLAAKGSVVSTNDAALIHSHALALRHTDARWIIATVASADSPRDQRALEIALLWPLDGSCGPAQSDLLTLTPLFPLLLRL